MRFLELIGLWWWWRRRRRGGEGEGGGDGFLDLEVEGEVEVGIESLRRHEVAELCGGDGGKKVIV